MFITHSPTVTFHLHKFNLFRTCCTSSALLRGNWQDFDLHDASAIAELLVVNQKQVQMLHYYICNHFADIASVDECFIFYSLHRILSFSFSLQCTSNELHC